MFALLASPLARYALAGLAAVLLVGGAYLYVDHKARVDERAALAAKAAAEAEKSRKLRETNDEKARSLDDDAALKCLRQPSGCR